MAASVSGILTLIIVLIVAPVTAYLYNRFLHQHVKARWVRHVSESRMMSVVGARMPRFSRTGSMANDGADGDEQEEALTQSMRQHFEEFEGNTRSNSAVMFGLIGSAVGLGNVYRFPFVIADNGGGSALIVYCISLALVAYPLFFYESLAGYLIRRSPVQAMRTIRLRWCNIGVGQMIMLIILMSYYSTITSYCLVFLVGSCQDPMPWTKEAQNAETNSEAAQKYWYDDVLNNFTPEELETRKSGDLGGLNGSVVGAIAVTWVVTFVSMAFGQDLVEKITRVTVIAPIIIMIIMVISANLLPGASDGIVFYIGKFDTSVFSDIAVWASCLGQVVFSLGPGLGVAMSYGSSLEDPKVNMAKLCAIVAIVNASFSIFSGFFTFAVVGHVSHQTGEPIQDVTDNAGQGLTFVVAPVAMNSFGAAANTMSVLFFLMLFTLGIDSIFAYTETILAAIDGIAHVYKKEKYMHRMSTMVFTTIVMFMLSLPYASRMSTYITDVMDYFSNTIGLLFGCFAIMLALCIDFKYERVMKAVNDTGHAFSKYYAWPTFYFFAPVGSLFLALYLFINTIRDPFPQYQELGILDDLSSLIAIGWSALAVLLVCFFGALWRCEPSSLPPLTPNEDDNVELNEINEHEVLKGIDEEKVDQVKAEAEATPTIGDESGAKAVETESS